MSCFTLIQNIFTSSPPQSRYKNFLTLGDASEAQKAEKTCHCYRAISWPCSGKTPLLADSKALETCILPIRPPLKVKQESFGSLELNSPDFQV